MLLPAMRVRAAPATGTPCRCSPTSRTVPTHGPPPRRAEGVGLFRTELAFLGRAQEPSVEEQAAGYAEVLAAFPGRKVVIRTLDAGSDKPLAFATSPDEANPALGVRGLRVARGNPGLLERQLDAVAEAAARTGSTPWVMAPMVATVPEAAEFAAAVRSRGLVPGVMIEVPSAALHAERLLAHVDFLSIGTNDLSQYALAADRLSADLAELTDPWQPALLQLVGLTAEAGRRGGEPGGVGGGGGGGRGRGPGGGKRVWAWAVSRQPIRCSAACWWGSASPRCRAPPPPWRGWVPGCRRSTGTRVSALPRRHWPPMIRRPRAPRHARSWPGDDTHSEG